MGKWRARLVLAGCVVGLSGCFVVDGWRASAGASADTVADADEMIPPAVAPTVVPGADRYGAIALGEEQEYGVSWDWPHPEGAQQRALEECHPGPSCRVVAFVVGPTCGAVAVGRTSHGRGGGATPTEAGFRALAECSGGTRSCSVAAWVCNAQP